MVVLGGSSSESTSENTTHAASVYLWKIGATGITGVPSLEWSKQWKMGMQHPLLEHPLCFDGCVTLRCIDVNYIHQFEVGVDHFMYWLADEQAKYGTLNFVGLSSCFLMNMSMIMITGYSQYLLCTKLSIIDNNWLLILPCISTLSLWRGT